METWLAQLQEAKKTSMVADGVRKVHLTFKDGTELVEEYDLKAGILLVRKWQRKAQLGGSKGWQYEVGEAPPVASSGLLAVSSTNPIFVRSDTSKNFEWRIRNLPYPLDIYQLTVENEQLVLRTTNKKYFKKFEIEDLKRCGLSLESGLASMAHANNTLIITYPKPEAILKLEAILRDTYKKGKAVEEGDVDCHPS
eukprot:m.17249 g.17249  ORF g.17249 m.17249 type:complete len:196 (-) comp11089_c0_seq1:24-611(-)